MPGRNLSSINIDEIFESGREPTEEEWKIWALEFKPKNLPRRKAAREVSYSKPKAAIALRDKNRKRKEYRDRKLTNHKSWGRKYNLKRKYLLLYNEQWKTNQQTTDELRKYRLLEKKYNSWVGKYKRTYKYNLAAFANTYKLGDNEYVYGFTEEQIRIIGPFAILVYKRLKESGVIPEPVMEGYMFKKNKVAKVKSKFYLMTEAKSYFDILAANKKKLGHINSEQKELFIKKKLWLAMLERREEFNNERQT
jgi:hypothetical protein